MLVRIVKPPNFAALACHECSPLPEGAKRGIGDKAGLRYHHAMRMIRQFAMICALWLAAGAIAHAQTLVENEYTTTEITPEAQAFIPGETLWFAVRQELRDGWHVFWVNPGDAGLPLALEWDLPAGFVHGEIIHPSPEYIPVGPLASYAHEGAPVFLVPVSAPAHARPGEIVDIVIHASWQTCEEICVPEEGRFSFSLPVAEEAAPDANVASLFAAARAAHPVEVEANAVFRVKGAGYSLTLTAPDDFAPDDAFYFAAPEGVIEPAARQTIKIDGGQAVIALQPGWRDGYDMPTLDGVLTFQTAAGARAGYVFTAAVPEPIVRPVLQSPPPAPQSSVNVPLLFALAFFGGVILNIMPCVFPIVFIKAASFMRSVDEDPAMVRRDGAFYTAGVLATFLALGGALLVLRAGGEQLGWGFHLQSPWVVALSAYILLLVGLNLAGVYSVNIGLAGSGEVLTSKGGATGAFFTGALAVVVAAPCIGPLLSAPMGAALFLPPVAGLLIFIVLGLGLAAPYLVLSLAPGLGRWLPKPGAWMTAFKQVLAFPVFAAAAYFVWVLAQQAGGGGLAAVLAGAVLLAFAAWAFERSKGEGRTALFLRAMSALALLGALAPLLRVEAAALPTKGDSERFGALTAESFSQKAVDAYRAAGVPVFIDFTAAWCITCQFDKVTVFSDDAVAQAFAEQGVAFMVADWTVRDPEITAALESFGASGVPLYVYYGPDGTPHVLDIPLTKKAVIEAVSGFGL